MTMITRRHLSLAAGMAAAVALTAGALIASTAEASTPAAMIGQAAPDFTGVTSHGETVSLSDFAGKTVILEWTNDGCPFVVKHYADPVNNMQTLQKTAAEQDMVWLTIISSRAGEQGHATPDRANQLTDARGAAPAHVILDESGDIGRLYDAKVTPHMFIITPEGELVYDGAIDSVRSSRVADIEGADNYVSIALAELAAGQPVSTPVTQPYGCSVKY